MGLFSSYSQTCVSSCVVLLVFFFFLIILFIYLFLAVLGLHCCAGVSLVGASRGFSLVAVLRLHNWWLLLWRTCSVVVPHGLSCSMTCGIFLNPGWKLCLLLWRANSLPLSHQGSPCVVFLNQLPFLELVGYFCYFYMKVLHLFLI